MGCISCPKSVRDMVGPHERLVGEAFGVLQKKLAQNHMQFCVSFGTCDLEELPSRVQKFNVDAASSLSTFCSFPASAKNARKVFDDISHMGAHLNIAFLSRECHLDAGVVSDVSHIKDALMGSGVDTVQVSIGDNSLSYSHFVRQRDELLSASRVFMKDLDSALGVSEGDSFKSFSHQETFDFLLFHCSGWFEFGKKSLSVTRRVMSAVPVDGSAQWRSRKRTGRDVFSGKGFSPNDMVLTLTPIGVRVSHTAHDVKNPFFWFSYDELFSLMDRYKKMTSFCSAIRATVNATLQIGSGNLDDYYFEFLNHETITEIADMRRVLLE